MADARETDLLNGIESRIATPERYNVFVVADYGVGDLAFVEVAAKLRSLHGGISAEKLSVPPFSTLSTGFAIGQIAEDAYPGMVIFSNTAPRGTEEAIKWQGDDRQRLLFAMLKIQRGEEQIKVPTVAISTGYNWSFVKDRIMQYPGGSYAFYDLDIPNSGTQFRSRDLYPDALSRVLRKDATVLGTQIDPAVIPDVPLDRIGYVDGYGNVKTTTRSSQFPVELKHSPLLKVKIGDIQNIVYNSLSGQEAGVMDYALNAGSSGGSDPFLEIIKRGGSAYFHFGNPHIYDRRDPIVYTPVATT